MGRVVGAEACRSNQPGSDQLQVFPIVRQHRQRRLLSRPPAKPVVCRPQMGPKSAPPGFRLRVGATDGAVCNEVVVDTPLGVAPSLASCSSTPLGVAPSSASGSSTPLGVTYAKIVNSTPLGVSATPVPILSSEAKKPYATQDRVSLGKMPRPALPKPTINLPIRGQLMDHAAVPKSAAGVIALENIPKPGKYILVPADGSGKTIGVCVAADWC